MAIATPEFLAAWLPSGRRAATLVKVELTDPSALTLHLSNVEIATPGSPPQFWQGALSDIGSVVEHGNLGASDPGLATFDFELSGRPLRGQASTDSALKLLASHYWYGAKVTAYYWEQGLADFAQALQIFTGVVVEVAAESNFAAITCQQRNAWVVRVPLLEVTRGKYPRAPEKSIGLPIPFDYGDGRAPEARFPADEYGAFNQTVVGSAGLRRAFVRGVVTRLGKGDGGKGQVLFASHACKLFNDDAAGSTPAIEMGDRLGEIDPNGADVVNGAGGTGFNYDDITSAGVQPFDCFYPVFAVDSKQSASNQGDNARAATDGFNDTSYARLDYDAGEREIIIPLPDATPMGLYISARAIVAWSTSPGATGVRADYVNPTGGGHTATLAATANLSTKTGAGTPIGSGKPTANWNFGGDGCYIRVYFTGVATGEKAHIFFVGAAVKFRPNWPVVTPASSYEVPKPGYYTKPPHRQFLLFGPRVGGQGASRTIDVPATNRVDAAFYATLQGYADDGSGTHTGVAAALIERPPDVLRHFLETHCAETLFETGVGQPGSLVDLRDHLKTWRHGDMKVALAVDEFRQSSDVVRGIARDSMCWFFISCFTDKWVGVPWKNGRAVDFPRRLSRADVMDPAGPKIILHRDDVQNDFRVGYGRDAWTRRTVHEVFLSPSRSSSGHRYRSLRHERITVVASESDRLNFKIAASSYTASLTAGDYTPEAFMQHVDAQMAAVAGNVIQLGWGLLVVAGYNDVISFNDGGAKTATLAAGDYNNDPAGLAAAAQAAMNAVSSNWTVVYSAATRKFTFDRSSGTKSMTWSHTSGAALAFGFGHSLTVAGPATSAFAVEPERFVIGTGSTDALSLLWETGADGIDAATPRACGELLGFDMARDYAEGTSYAIAHSPKNIREHAMAQSVARYGTRPTLETELDYVNDTDTAREALNRMADLWQQPPVEIQFASERLPDLQKGMVFDFDASLDEVKPFTVPGTDGSWLGKKFVAVQPERLSMPTPHQRVVAYLVEDD